MNHFEVKMEPDDEDEEHLTGNWVLNFTLCWECACVRDCLVWECQLDDEAPTHMNTTCKEHMNTFCIECLGM